MLHPIPTPKHRAIARKLAEEFMAGDYSDETVAQAHLEKLIEAALQAHGQPEQTQGPDGAEWLQVGSLTLFSAHGVCSLGRPFHFTAEHKRPPRIQRMKAMTVAS